MLYSCSAPATSYLNNLIPVSTPEDDYWAAAGWGTQGAQAGASYPEDEDENTPQDFGYDDCPFEFDDDTSDGDCSSSITDSIRGHVYEDGLRYHAYHPGKYAFPNDENEQSREEIKHNMSVMLSDGQLFYAPVEEALEDGGEVLDLGTGTGRWPMQCKLLLLISISETPLLTLSKWPMNTQRQSSQALTCRPFSPVLFRKMYASSSTIWKTNGSTPRTSTTTSIFASHFTP